MLERESSMPPLHRHEFAENCEGMIAFGYSREDDERSLIAFLQKFSDDDLMQLLSPRLSDQEIDNLVNLLMGLLKKHLSDGEYHRYFLKEGQRPGSEPSREDGGSSIRDDTTDGHSERAFPGR